ncbi:hypothetical protein C4573_01925 [Candidatus Woesearchaeota archaeon]|nr:MAG: hypothetical protein C4573_01925 [Candidatus Woesearchaeota archaeon]
MLEAILHSKLTRSLTLGLALLTTGQVPFENPIKPLHATTIESFIDYMLKEGTSTDGNVYDLTIYYDNSIAIAKYFFDKSSKPAIVIGYPHAEGIMTVLDGGIDGPIDGIPDKYGLTSQDIFNPGELSLELGATPLEARAREDVTAEMQYIIRYVVNRSKTITSPWDTLNLKVEEHPELTVLDIPPLSPYLLTQVMASVKNQPLINGKHQMETSVQGGRTIVTYTPDEALDVEWYGRHVLKVRETQIDGKPEHATYTDRTVKPEIKYADVLVHLAQIKPLQGQDILNFLQFCAENSQSERLQEIDSSGAVTKTYTRYTGHGVLTSIDRKDTLFEYMSRYSEIDGYYADNNELYFIFNIPNNDTIYTVREGYPNGLIDGIPEEMFSTYNDQKITMELTVPPPQQLYAYRKYFLDLAEHYQANAAIKDSR